MSKNNQFFIECPRTKRKLTVSRDVYHALQYAKESMEKQGTDINQKMKKSSEALCKKQYIGSTKDIDIAVKFEANGKAEPTVELKNSLDNLDGKTQRIVQDVLYQFVECINQTLVDRASDANKELERTLTKAA